LAVGRLTQNGAERLVEPGKYGDGDHLYLIVMCDTSKHWSYRYWEDAKEQWLRLGSFAELSVKNARVVRDAARMRIESNRMLIASASGGVAANHHEDRQRRVSLARKSSKGRLTPKITYLSCLQCGTSYWARKEARPNQQFGKTSCGHCGRSALEWSGFYELVDCRPIQVGTTKPRAGRPTTC
jgi:hypothetical protein